MSAARSSQDDLGYLGAEKRSDPIVFLSNRYNLLEILSSGIVSPRAALGKYYPDLLDLAPGRIPLLQAPLATSVVGAVAGRNDETSFPIAIEISTDHLDANPLASLRSGTSRPTPVRAGRAQAWAAPGAIASAAMVKVHFRSPSDLEEHSVREYENVPSGIPLAVTPALFEGGSLTLDELTQWLASLQGRDQPDKQAFGYYDRLSGARCLASFAATPDALPGLLSFLQSTSLDSKTVDGFPHWLTSSETLSPREHGWRGRSIEERAYSSAVRVLRQVDPAQAWRPLDVLSSVEREIVQTQLPKKNEGEVLKALAAIGAILRNERAFRAFRPGIGSPVIKALLMVLMRPQPKHFFSWAETDSGADPHVRLTAAALLGVLHGHKRINVEFRTRPLDQFLAVAAVREMCKPLRDGLRPAPAAEALVISTQARDNEELVSLNWGSSTLVARARKRSPWPPIEKALSEDPQLKEAVALFCLERGWNDCVGSRVTLGTQRFELVKSGADTDIVVEGSVSVTVSIDGALLLERLRDPAIAKAFEAALSGKLATPSPSVKPDVAPELVRPTHTLEKEGQ